MRHTRLCAFLLWAVAGTGCGANAMHDSAPVQAPQPSYGEAVMDAAAPGAMPSPQAQSMAQGAPSRPGSPQTRMSPPGASPAAAHKAKESAATGKKKQLGGDHLLIFTGGLSMEVDAGEFSQAIDKVVDIAADFEGYVAKQNDQSVTVRVPSRSFRKALREMEKLGDVVHRSVQAEDVSEEYHDLGVRLKSFKATRVRLEKFLDRAKTIEEVLRVEKELGRLNAEIDRLEGRMRFLAQRAAMSTITASFVAKPVAKKVVVKKKAPPPPPPPKKNAKTRTLPIDWLSKVGIDNLLNLR